MSDVCFLGIADVTGVFVGPALVRYCAGVSAVSAFPLQFDFRELLRIVFVFWLS